jgi:hypothetical protein
MSTQQMKTISAVTGIRLPDWRIFSSHELGGSAAGTLAGLRRLHQTM